MFIYFSRFERSRDEVNHSSSNDFLVGWRKPDCESSRMRLMDDKHVHCPTFVFPNARHYWMVPPTAKMAVFSIIYKYLIRVL